MPAGQPKTSGKSHNNTPTTYSSALRNQQSSSTSSSSSSCKLKSLDCYFKILLKDTRDATLEPPTYLQRVDIF